MTENEAFERVALLFEENSKITYRQIVDDPEIKQYLEKSHIFLNLLMYILELTWHVEGELFMFEEERSCVGVWSNPELLIRDRLEVDNSDMVTHHCYKDGEWTKEKVTMNQMIIKMMDPKGDYPHISLVPIDSNNQWSRDS